MLSYLNTNRVVCQTYLWWAVGKLLDNSGTSSNNSIGCGVDGAYELKKFYWNLDVDKVVFLRKYNALSELFIIYIICN